MKNDFKDRDYNKIRKLILEMSGINIGENKKEMVKARMGKLMRTQGFENISEILDRIADGDKSLIQEFINCLTTNKTSFFRESHHFDFLLNYIKANKERSIKIWCQAASTGEEPYSLAMTILEAYGGTVPFGTQILCSDIDTEVLEKGRVGVYNKATSNLDDNLISKYWEDNGDTISAKRCLKDLISFTQFNLMDSFLGKSGYDFIFCRNVMIYFNEDMQRKILDKSKIALKDTGFFVAGHSENFSFLNSPFKSIGKTIYVKKGNLNDNSYW